MNPYDAPSSIHNPDQRIADRVQSKLPAYLAAGTLGALSGMVVWGALFIGLGFDSSFGRSLTTLYGRDLISNNLDWVILAPITSTAAFVVFLLSTTIVRSFSLNYGPTFGAKVLCYSVFSGMASSAMGGVLAWIAYAVHVDPTTPILLTICITALASVPCVPVIFCPPGSNPKSEQDRKV